MPLLLILAFAVAAYLVAPIDPVTLRATRGAAGAIRSGLAPAGSGRAPAPTGSTRATSPRRSKTASPSPRSGRPGSRIGAAIRGGLDAADRAEARRGDLLVALGEWRDRTRARRLARRIRDDEDRAHDENDRRDRAAALARISDGVQQTAQKIADPPAPPAQPNGAAVPQPTDLQHIAVTELNTLYQLGAEASDARRLAEQLHQGANELDGWVANLDERVTRANYIYTTNQTAAALAMLKEHQLTAITAELRSVMDRLTILINAVETARTGVKESDAISGRVETALAD